MIIWKFVDYLTSNEPPDDEYEDTCDNVLTLFYEMELTSSYEDLDLHIVCPCFPDAFSDRLTYDYCKSISIFDGCPNFFRHEKPDATS